MLRLHCCVDFSLVAVSGDSSLVAVHGLLTVVASLVAEHGLLGLWTSVVAAHGFKFAIIFSHSEGCLFTLKQ